MALTLTTVSKNKVLDVLWDQANGGVMEVQITGNVEAATLGFSPTAFAAASANSKTANAISPDTNATGNATDVSICQFFTSAPLAFAQGSVGLAGENLNLSTLTINAGDIVICTTMTASIS